MFSKNITKVTAEQALPGRNEPLQIRGTHFVNGSDMLPPFTDNLQIVQFGMGCFWGAEKKFWPLSGVLTTAVGYSAGFTPNPTYQEVCSGETGHNEVVLVVYDPAVIPFAELLKVFWESHDPTQGNRQGNDCGTQYRSGIYCSTDRQQAEAESGLQSYQQLLQAKSFPAITTEILLDTKFYYAEEYHQQYLAKNPQGYCGLGGTGVSCS